jgi:membrane protease YdiL (CAAX protease family)
MNRNSIDDNDERNERKEIDIIDNKIDGKTDKAVPWTPRDVLIALFWFLAIITAGSLLVRKALGTFMPEGAPVITLLIGYLVSLLLLKHYTIGRGAKWTDLGIKPFEYLHGTGLVVGAFIITKVITAVYAVIMKLIGLEQSPDIFEKLPNLFGRSIGGFLLAIFVVAVVAPIVEELFFRGFVYASFRQSHGVTTAAIVSSLMFALFHQDPYTYIPIAIIGLALVYLYETTGSLWPSIMLHSLNNLLSVVVLYYYRVPMK